MKSVKKSVNNLVSEKPSHLILGVFFFIYILTNVQTPEFLATFIDNIFGKVLIVAFAAVIFMKTNPVIGVLGFVVAYQMIKTASIATGTYAMKHYLPSESSKMNDLRKFNDEEVSPLVMPCGCQGQCSCMSVATATTNNAGSLEAEMVSKMAPLVMSGGESNLEYKPVLDGQHSAAPLDEA